MDATHFPEYWGVAAIVVAGASAIVSIPWDVRDKDTKRITFWGRFFLCITVVSTVGALTSQVLQNRQSDARNKKTQDDTIKLLTDTRQSIFELSRILQPLDRPDVTLLLDLECGPIAFKDFCVRAQEEERRVRNSPRRELGWRPRNMGLEQMGRHYSHRRAG
jgi:hypothetical protein